MKLTWMGDEPDVHLVCSCKVLNLRQHGTDELCLRHRLRSSVIQFVVRINHQSPNPVPVCTSCDRNEAVQWRRDLMTATRAISRTQSTVGSWPVKSRMIENCWLTQHNPSRASLAFIRGTPLGSHHHTINRRHESDTWRSGRWSRTAS